MIVWKLDELLRHKGVKGRELARRMAIGENYLSRVRHEVPDRLSLSLLDALCRELGCTLGDLLEYRPEPGAEPPPEPRPKKKVAPRAKRQAARSVEVPVVAEDESDFGAVVAAALGEALEVVPTETAPPAEPQGAVMMRKGALGAKLQRLRELKSRP